MKVEKINIVKLKRCGNVILMVCLMLIALLMPLPASAVDWRIETVDSAGDVGMFASIAVDSNNKVHISYHDYEPNVDLKYATNASGAWVTSTIDSAGSVGWYISIAVDSNNRAHISYWDATNRDLKYATNASGAWVTSTIDSAGSVGSDTSIAVDSNNRVHISYWDAINSDLKYATNASGAWVTSTIDSAGSVGSNTSIAVDSNNKMHISYFDYTNSDLKYATNASGSWATSTIDSAGYVGLHPSTAVDSNNKVHISYIASAYLKYATNVSGAWVISTIDDDGIVWSPSIAVDSNDKVHISYRDATNSDLKLATNASGSWAAFTIDSDSDVGAFVSIAMDSNDTVHISYMDYTNRVLKYAVSMPCTDTDGDGYAVEGGACGPVDCNDNNVSINPGTTEVCNGIDDNCDGQIDEGNVCGQPPVANAGPDQTVEATSAAGASVTLNGSGSTDPQNSALTYQWSGPFGTGTGASPMVTMPLGTHDVALIVTNSYGLTGSDVVKITVRDTVPPVTGAAVTGTVGSNNWYVSDAVVSLSSLDTGAGVREILYRINEGTWMTVAGGNASILLSVDDVHVVTYYAIDKASNSEGPQSITVKIDKTPPVITISGVQDGAVYEMGTVPSAGYDVSDTHSGVASSSATLSGGDGLGLGTFIYTVLAGDNASNSATATVTYTVVATPAGLIPVVSELVNAGEITTETAAVLTSMLETIQSAPNDQARANKAKALINHIEARAGKSITPEAAAALIEAAEALVAP